MVKYTRIPAIDENENLIGKSSQVIPIPPGNDQKLNPSKNSLTLPPKRKNKPPQQWGKYLCPGLILFIIFLMLTSTPPPPPSGGNEQCFSPLRIYDQPWKLDWLDDIMLSARKPRLGETIFFHYTKCNKDESVQLTTREACAIEAAARTHPDRDIFVLFASPVGWGVTIALPHFKALLSYKNIFWRNVNIWSYARDTPADQWISDSRLLATEYFQRHVLDYLKYSSLYKFGGTTVDFNTILQKSLSNLTSNYAGAENDDNVSSNVVNFDYVGVGHDMAGFCLRAFVRYYYAHYWSLNSVNVINHALSEICSTDNTRVMTMNRCSGFNVLDPTALYAIDRASERDLFDPVAKDTVMKMIENSLGVHIWNLHKHRKPILKSNDKKIAYHEIAEQSCPNVYALSGEYF